jgi:lipopolysaccharide export system protein LptA
MSYLFLVVMAKCCFAAANPFSRIVVTSNHATCNIEKDNKQDSTFTYKDNVVVTLADESKITSDSLEVVFNTKSIKNQISKSKSSEEFVTKTENNEKSDYSKSIKEIIFSNNVCIKQKNHTITSDKAELFLNKQLCRLAGNVIVIQEKHTSKDTPILIKSCQATLNIKTNKVSFEGTTDNPVSTTINLQESPLLKKEPQKKTTKQKKRRFKI